MRLPTMREAFGATAATTVLLLTAACGSDAETTGGSSSSSSAAPESDSSDSSSSGTYADGTYEAEGEYSNPGGQSKVKVELTLADNEVTDVTVTPEASNGTSRQYQTQFAGGVADEVVGKSLDDLDVSKVAGSSLTSTGFNEAIETIKGEAQA